MVKIHIYERTNGIIFLNGTDTSKHIENKTIKPFQYTTFPTQLNNQVNVWNQVYFPLSFPYRLLCICYESNGQSVIFPVTIFNRKNGEEASFRVINLTKKIVSINAKHGDYLGELSYQEQLKPISLSSKMDLYIDYYRNGKLFYAALEKDIKGGSQLLHILTENKMNPIISLEIMGNMLGQR